MSYDSFRLDAEKAVTFFDAWVASTTPQATADHICYKCGSREEFEYLRTLFETYSSYIHQSPIAGRPIAYIKFLQPLKTSLGDIWFLELSDQKPNNSQVSGFDHIEIYPKQDSIETLVSDLESKGVQFKNVVRPHHTTFDTILESGLKVRLEPEALIEKIIKEEL